MASTKTVTVTGSKPVSLKKLKIKKSEVDVIPRQNRVDMDWLCFGLVSNAVMHKRLAALGALSQ